MDEIELNINRKNNEKSTIMRVKKEFREELRQKNIKINDLIEYALHKKETENTMLIKEIKELIKNNSVDYDKLKLVIYEILESKDVLKDLEQIKKIKELTK